MTLSLGDFQEDSIVSFPFTTHAGAGGAVAPSDAFEIADVRVYKNSSATQRSSSSGMTMTSPFDSVTGLHMVEIDTSDNTDAGFWVAGSQYHVVLVPDTETVDSQTVVAVLATFGIVASSGGKFAADLVSTVGAPSDLNGGGATLAGMATDGYNMSNTVKIAVGSAGAGLTAVPWNSAWDAEVQSEAEDALVANGLDHLVVASVTGTDIADNSIIAKMVSKSATADWDSFANTTDALEALRDNAGTNGASLSVGIKSSGITSASFAADSITASAIAADAIGSSELAASAAAEIADAVHDEALSGHTTAGSAGKALSDAATYAASISSNVTSILTVVSSTGVAIASATMTSIADALLKRDLSVVTGEASRSPLNALRFLRNKWSISGSTLTVTKEDDTTAAWTAALTTNASADPITGSDPA